MNRYQLERELRARLSDAEFRELVQQLQGAVTAIDFLRHRAPDVLQVFFANMKFVNANDVPDQARHALQTLADELRAARMSTLPKPKPLSSRAVLRLAYSDSQ